MVRKLVNGRCVCRKCGATFDAANMATGYCPTCRDAFCSRTCAQCDKIFHVDEPWDEKTTCSRHCRQAAAWKARRANYQINPPVVKLLAVPRTCRQCGDVFIAERSGAHYCPPCLDALINRTCAHCEKGFTAQSPSKKQIYCSQSCGAIAQRAREKLTRTPARASRPLVQCQYRPCGKMFAPQKGRVNRFCSFACWQDARRDADLAARVRCAWAACPRPDDLLRPYEHKYHFECWQAYRRTSSTPPTAIRPCEACRQPITYRTDRKHRPKIHPACRGAYMRARPKKGEERRCEQCGDVVYRVPSELAISRHTFCSRDCGVAWKREHGDELPIARMSPSYALGKRVEIRCIACQETRQCQPSMVPVSVDQTTLTWTCPRCMPRGSMAVWITCADPKCQRQVRRQIKDFDPEKPYYCSVACRWEVNRKVAKKRLKRLTCPICYKEYQKGQRIFARTKFTITPSRARMPLPQSGKRCCGRKHARLYRIQVEERERVCPVCKTMFLPTIKDQVYCDRKCAGVGRTGKPISPRPWRAEMKDKACAMWSEGARSFRQIAGALGIDWRTAKQFLEEENLLDVAAV